jgi:hypothetical protein
MPLPSPWMFTVWIGPPGCAAMKIPIGFAASRNSASENRAGTTRTGAVVPAVASTDRMAGGTSPFQYRATPLSSSATWAYPA